MTIAVTLPELQELIGRGAQLVVVLPEAEYAEAHLPGAVNIPLEQLDASTTSLLDRERRWWSIAGTRSET